MAPKKTNGERLTALETDVKWLKILVGASVAANIGIQFVNSPVHTIVLNYVAMFATIFLLAAIVLKWRTVSFWHKASCLCLVIFVLFSTVMRTYIYEAGVSPAPSYYAPALDCIMIILVITFMIAHWNGRNNA